MLTVDELKILLALNGDQRIVHLEEEIFANSELTRLYLLRLSIYRILTRYKRGNGFESYNAVQHVEDNDWHDSEIIAWAIFYYARDVLDSRWPSAEHLLNNFKVWKYSNYRKDYNEHFGISL